MRLVIEARIEGDDTSDAEPIVLAVVERENRSVTRLGLTLAEGRELLAQLQSRLVSRLVSRQTANWMADQLFCSRCATALAHKDSRQIVMARGRSRMRSCCTYGSERGAGSNLRPYRDRFTILRLQGWKHPKAMGVRRVRDQRALGGGPADLGSERAGCAAGGQVADLAPHRA